MLELRELLVASIDNLVASGAIEKAMEEAIAKTVTGVLKDQLREYSEFGKLVTKAVEKSLALHGDLNLPAYNHSILKIVEAQVKHATEKSIEREVAGRMKSLLTPAPERIKLSTLVEQYVQHLKDQQEGGCTCWGGDEVAHVQLREDRSSSSFLTLHLAPTDDKPSTGSRQKDAISIGLHVRQRSEDGEPKVATIYHLSFQNVDVEKQMFVGDIRAFERTIFQMRAANTSIEIDCDPASSLDLYYGAHERM